MAIRTVILLVLCLLTALFLALNWAGVMAPVPVNLLVVDTQAPLGFILLLIFGFLFVAVLFWALFKQAALLTEVRRINKAAIADRSLAQDAENSRFEEVRKALIEATESLGKDSSGKVAAFMSEQKKSREDLTAQIDALRKSVDRLNSMVQIISRAELPPLPSTPGKEPKAAHQEAVETVAAMAAMQSDAPAAEPEKPKPAPAAQESSAADEKEPKQEAASEEPPAEPKKGFFSKLFGSN